MSRDKFPEFLQPVGFKAWNIKIGLGSCRYNVEQAVLLKQWEQMGEESDLFISAYGPERQISQEDPFRNKGAGKQHFPSSINNGHLCEDHSRESTLTTYLAFTKPQLLMVWWTLSFPVPLVSVPVPQQASPQKTGTKASNTTFLTCGF